MGGYTSLGFGRVLYYTYIRFSLVCVAVCRVVYPGAITKGVTE